MKKALLLYSSYDGQAFTIISRIALRVAEQAEDIEYEVYDLEEVPNINLDNYSVVLVGGVIRYNKFNKVFLKFINNNYKKLNEMKTAFVCINLSARKHGKDTSETNDHAKAFLAKTSWRPKIVGVFAGSLRYPQYTWYNKMIMKAVMWLDGERQDVRKEYDYTNWQKVDEFAEQLISLTHQS